MRQYASSGGRPHLVLQAEGLGLQHLAAEVRDAEVLPSLVASVARRAAVGGCDESLLNQLVQAAIQVRGFEAEPARRALLNGLRQAVAVQIVLVQGEQDLELDGRQW